MKKTKLRQIKCQPLFELIQNNKLLGFAAHANKYIQYGLSIRMREMIYGIKCFKYGYEHTPALWDKHYEKIDL